MADDDNDNKVFSPPVPLPPQLSPWEQQPRDVLHPKAYEMEQMTALLKLIENEVEPQLPPVNPFLLFILERLLTIYGGITIFTNIGMEHSDAIDAAAAKANLPRPLQPVSNLKYEGDKKLFIHDGSADFTREYGVESPPIYRLRMTTVVTQKRWFGIIPEETATLDFTARDAYEKISFGLFVTSIYKPKYEAARILIGDLLVLLDTVGLNMHHILNTHLLPYYNELQQTKDGIRALQERFSFSDLKWFDYAALARARKVVMDFGGPHPVKLLHILHWLRKLRNEIRKGVWYISQMRYALSNMGYVDILPKDSMIPQELLNQLGQIPAEQKASSSSNNASPRKDSNTNRQQSKRRNTSYNRAGSSSAASSLRQ
jgi:hypothetical protein